MKKWKLCFWGFLLGAMMSGCENQNDKVEHEPVNTEIVDEQNRKDVIEAVLNLNLETYVDSDTINATFMNEIIFRNLNSMEAKFSYIEKENGEYLQVYNSNTFSQIVSYYGAEDEKRLYAFTVTVGDYENGKPLDYPVRTDAESKEEFQIREYQYIRQTILNALKGTDLYIMEDYPFSYGYELKENQEPYEKMYQYIQGYFTNRPACVVIGSIEDLKALCEFGKAINGLYLHFTSALRPDIVEDLVEKGYTAENVWEKLWSPEFYQQIFGEDDFVEVSVNVKCWR